MKKLILVPSILGLTLMGCAKESPTPTQAVSPAPAAGKPAPTSAPVAAAPAGPTSQPGTAASAKGASMAGKVVETMNSGGYTYALINDGKGTVWAAGPEAALKVGDGVSFSGGMLMANYHSKTLNRTFEGVYFVPAFNVRGAAAAAPSSQPAPTSQPATASRPAAPASPTKVGAVARAGKTIAEVFAQKDTLGAKPVSVRGKVVKFNAGIMGSNWIHIQDGTGAAGTNDLTLTTKATAAVGDTVVATGPITRNKDFGAGYKFDVIMEDATVVSE